MRLAMGYPQKESERQMLNAFVRENPLDSLEPVMSREELLEGRRQVREIRAGEAVQDYILAIVEATRSHEKNPAGRQPPRLPGPAPGHPGLGRNFRTGLCDSRRREGRVLRRPLPPASLRGSHLSQGPQFAREVLTELLQQVPVPTEAEISG